MKLIQAQAIRNALLRAGKDLTDENAVHVKFLYNEWETATAYATGDRVTYQGNLYKCLQAHTSQDGWNPTDAPSLWSKILPGQGGTVGEWVQPDSTNPYMMGERVTHNGSTWESELDYNVWEPGVAGWTEV